MKTISSLRSFFTVIIGLFSLSGSVAYGQFYTINIPGIVNTPEAVSAIAELDFDTSAQTLTVELFNTSDIESRITVFYFLKPSTVTSGALLSFSQASPFETGWSAKEGDDPPSHGLVGEPTGNPDKTFYYGADRDSGNTGIWSGDSGVFTFSYADLGVDTIDFLHWESAWDDDELFHFGVRWQSMDVVDSSNADSARGIGILDFDDIIIVPVPEPGHIALMALAGMGGLLLIRRRLARKG